MDYSKLAGTVDKKLERAVELILNTEVDPETRRLNLEILLRETGSKIYQNIYAMNAYDMEIDYTEGVGINDHYYGMAKNLSDSISLGGKEEVQAQLHLWLRDQILKAQYDAFVTAYESGKYRVVTRTEPGGVSRKTHRYEPPCEWCKEHTGTFIEPSPEVFAQHDHCHGVIKTSGWKSHNGTLTGKGWKKLK